MKQLLLLSGGPDSTAASFLLSKENLILFTVSEQSRSKNICEVTYAKKIAQMLGVRHIVADFSEGTQLFGDVPEIIFGLGGGNKPGKRVPGFTKQVCVPSGKMEAPLSLAYLHLNAAIYAIAHGIDEIVWAVHADDNIPTGWIEDYVSRFNSLLSVFDFAALLKTPFLYYTKLELIQRGVAAGAPIQATFSCLNNSNFVHCGSCEGCREREKVFRVMGILDKVSEQEDKIRAA